VSTHMKNNFEKDFVLTMNEKYFMIAHACTHAHAPAPVHMHTRTRPRVKRAKVRNFFGRWMCWIEAGQLHL
jgi:hypothetical protein